MNYKEQKQKLARLLDDIKECLTDDNFTVEEKQIFFQFTCEIIGMLKCL